MTVRAYNLHNFGNSFEEEVFEYLSSALDRSSENYVLFGPVRVEGRDLDGLVIGPGFMVALEAKAYRGDVSMGPNIPITVKTEDGTVHKFNERYEMPYVQAEKHWKELSTFVRSAFGITGIWTVAMLIFKSGSTFDVTPQSRDVKTGSSLIVSLEEIPLFLAQLTSRFKKEELSKDQQDALIKAITEGPDKLSAAEKNIFASPATLARDTRPPYAPPPPSPKVSPEFQESDDAGTKIHPPRKSWVQSPWFLWFAFFFLNPVWAFLMLKDQERGWFVKLVATGFLLVQLLACLGVAYLVQMDPGIIGFPRAAPAPSSTPSPDLTTRQDMPEPTSAPSVQVETSPDTEDACTVIWVETGVEGLANKNRAMVWEQTIRARVAGSGMTDRQFYDQVLERNPALQTDGYVFLEGKTYYLPQCE